MVRTRFVTGRPRSASSGIGVRKQSVRSKASLMEADSVLGSLWDHDAAAWDRYWAPVFALFARDLVADASPRPGDLVLDVGTGTGVAAIEVRNAVPSVRLVVGIDRSEAMIRLARKRMAKAHLRNVRFHRMTAENLRFPDEFFDVVISNCGIAIRDFVRGMKEALRVLRPGGNLVFNDWHLIDVKPHQIFGEVLGKYRTPNPSPQLAHERSALALMESNHHSLSPETQKRIVHDAGFGEAKITTREHSIRLRGVDDFLKMRLSRLTIKREMSEMASDQRKLFLLELNDRLRTFVIGNRFVCSWSVFYISAKKPR
jgi:ubiquinone/menaquinone biosynthesis C-methylase UbiE